MDLTFKTFYLQKLSFGNLHVSCTKVQEFDFYLWIRVKVSREWRLQYYVIVKIVEALNLHDLTKAAQKNRFSIKDFFSSY